MANTRQPSKTINKHAMEYMQQFNDSFTSSTVVESVLCFLLIEIDGSEARNSGESKAKLFFHVQILIHILFHYVIQCV